MMTITSLPNQEVISEQMVQYKKVMNSLIHEKPGVNVQEKTKRSLELAQKIIRLGDPEDEVNEPFNNRISKQLEELCSLKPGRKLIKALSKSLESSSSKYKQVTIRDIPPEVEGLAEDYESKYVQIFLLDTDKKGDYLIQNHTSYTSEKPRFITLAHELIHAFHDLSKSKEFDLEDSTNRNLLKAMTDLEEQHTIIGYNDRLFSEKGASLNKLDILCENAFLLASGLQPRVSHKAPNDQPRFDQNVEGKIDVLAESYYKWLETELKNNLSNIA